MDMKWIQIGPIIAQSHKVYILYRLKNNTTFLDSVKYFPGLQGNIDINVGKIYFIK